MYSKLCYKVNTGTNKTPGGVVMKTWQKMNIEDGNDQNVALVTIRDDGASSSIVDIMVYFLRFVLFIWVLIFLQWSLHSNYVLDVY